MTPDVGIPLGTSVRLSVPIGKEVTRVRGAIVGRSKIVSGDYRYDVREEGGTIHSNLPPDRLQAVKPETPRDNPQ